MACEYCKGKPLLTEEKDFPSLSIRKRQLTQEKTGSQWMGSGIAYQKMKLINFCPMCGEKLGDEHE